MIWGGWREEPWLILRAMAVSRRLVDSRGSRLDAWTAQRARCLETICEARELNWELRTRADWAAAAWPVFWLSWLRGPHKNVQRGAAWTSR